MAFPKAADIPPADNIRGAWWMIANTVAFALSILAIKRIGDELPSAVIVFIRCLTGLVLVMPFILRKGLVVFRTQRPGLHVIRVFGSAISMIAAYYAYAHLPLATATSLSFTRPLFMIVMAILFLGEVVRWRRGLATAAGFAGVLIMLGPSGLFTHPAALAALLSAASVSVAMAVIRQQANVEGSLTLIAWFCAGTAFLTLFPAIPVWQTPTPEQWGYLIFIGVMSSAGQFFLIKAFTYGEATVMNPIDYTQIILAAIFGALFFNEIPSIWTALGAVIIVGSTLYILLREARMKKPPPPPAGQQE